MGANVKSQFLRYSVYIKIPPNTLLINLGAFDDSEPIGRKCFPPKPYPEEKTSTPTALGELNATVTCPVLILWSWPEAVATRGDWRPE